ncbi:AraC family transcriptional regulator [Paenibacillus cremeus]|uniref:AraC family transcriptional regulator n=1 Tax=Paenibacillus cremeus TaxID=2163881 RepID=A0A559KHX4_9BACL|nr:helix-turn-helix domain-containing protein [Paenibacillus cremeus]TVY11737.1 AraC family transcriptional regulator [Paenibacillus cremeus]
MPLSDNILKDRPFNLKHRDLTTDHFPGFYHYHRGIEILFVHRGKGHLVLNRQMYALEPGCLFFLQPFQLHRIHFDVSAQSPYERSVITFEPADFVPFFRMFPALLRFFEHMWKDELSNQVMQVGGDSAYLNSIFERLHHRVFGPYGGEQLEGAALGIVQLYEYLQSKYEDGDGSFQGVPRSERHTEKMLQWLEEHYTEPFDLNELAQELHLSKHHVSHLFRAETGSSITDYVIARRIRQACWLLNTEALSVEQVGTRVGIPNFSYFCRVFRRITGVTPKQYREGAALEFGGAAAGQRK